MHLDPTVAAVHHAIPDNVHIAVTINRKRRGKLVFRGIAGNLRFGPILAAIRRFCVMNLVNAADHAGIYGMKIAGSVPGQLPPLGIYDQTID